MSAPESSFDFDVSSHPPLPAARGLLVVGTAGGVGTTLIAGAIARELRRRGTVEVFKPVAVGCRRTREGLVSAEAEFLAACAGSRRPVAEIAPVRFAAALAPNVAAERARRPIDLQDVFDAYARIAAGPGPVIVDATGGLLCPITDGFWVVHLAKLAGLPLVVVAPAGAATVNEALLTLHAGRSAGLAVAGVVINRYWLEPPVRQPGAPPPSRDAGTLRDADLAALASPVQIAARGRVEVLAIVPDESDNSVAGATLGPDTRFAIAQADWHAALDRPAPSP